MQGMSLEDARRLGWLFPEAKQNAFWAQWGHLYQDMLVICPVDNQTACAWIAKLDADNYVGRALIAVLARHSARHHLELVSPYINTHRNKFADAPTRAHPRRRGSSWSASLAPRPHCSKRGLRSAAG